MLKAIKLSEFDAFAFPAWKTSFEEALSQIGPENRLQVGEEYQGYLAAWHLIGEIVYFDGIFEEKDGVICLKGNIARVFCFGRRVNTPVSQVYGKISNALVSSCWKGENVDPTIELTEEEVEGLKKDLGYLFKTFFDEVK